MALCLDEKLLRQISRPAFPYEDAHIVEKMVKAITNIDTLGVSAPQIGEFVRIIAVKSKHKDRYILPQPLEHVIMLNPQVVDKTDEKIRYTETCLSIKDYVSVKRSKAILVRYETVCGEKCLFSAFGLLSAAIQHEIDHLNGVLIKDYL